MEKSNKPMTRRELLIQSLMFDTSTMDYVMPRNNDLTLAPKIVSIPDFHFIEEHRASEEDCLILYDHGFSILSHSPALADTCVDPHATDLVGTLVNNVRDLYFCGQKVKKVDVDSCFIDTWPLKSAINSSFVDDGVLITQGASTNHIYGVVPITSYLVVKTIEISFFGFTSRRFKIIGRDIENTADPPATFLLMQGESFFLSGSPPVTYHKTLPWTEGVQDFTSAHLACVDGVFRLIPYSRIVQVKVKKVGSQSFAYSRSGRTLFPCLGVHDCVYDADFNAQALIEPQPLVDHAFTDDAISKVRNSAIIKDLSFCRGSRFVDLRFDYLSTRMKVSVESKSLTYDFGTQIARLSQGISDFSTVYTLLRDDNFVTLGTTVLIHYNWTGLIANAVGPNIKTPVFYRAAKTRVLAEFVLADVLVISSRPCRARFGTSFYHDMGVYIWFANCCIAEAAWLSYGCDAMVFAKQLFSPNVELVLSGVKINFWLPKFSKGELFQLDPAWKFCPFDALRRIRRSN